jgi:hypothetical protein
MYGVTNHFTENLKALDDLTASQETLDGYKYQLYLSKTAHNSPNWGGKGSDLVYTDGRVVRMEHAARITPARKQKFFEPHIHKIKSKITSLETILKIVARRNSVSE